MLFTALTIITDAALTIGAVAAGESLSTSEQNDGLDALNTLLDVFSSVGAMIMQLSQTTVGLVATQGPYNLGVRPAKIKAASCLSGPLSAPVEIVSAEQWAQIVDESRSGLFATKLFCDYEYPASNVYCWPKATGTLTVWYYLPMEQWPDLNTTSINLPPAYGHALKLNLAILLAHQYGRPVTQELTAGALEAKQFIMRANTSIFGGDAIPEQPMPQSPAQPEQPAQTSR